MEEYRKSSFEAWHEGLTGDEEWEFLLPRGSKFEITGIAEAGDDIVIKMRWIGTEKREIECATREDVIAWQKKVGIYDEKEAWRI